MDYAINNRQQIIREVASDLSFQERAEIQAERIKSGNEAKRIRAINILGSKWIMHPDYDSGRCAHHHPSFKKSAVLEVFMQGRMARELGRV